MWMSGGHRSGSSSVPTRTKRTAGPLPAGGAARDLLASSACRRRIDDLRLARGVHDSIRLVEGVERVGCTGLALAPATVAGVDDERRARQSIPDLAASASAFHGGPTNGGSNTRTLPFRQARGNGPVCTEN